jgi:hypothetical protein
VERNICDVGSKYYLYCGLPRRLPSACISARFVHLEACCIPAARLAMSHTRCSNQSRRRLTPECTPQLSLSRPSHRAHVHCILRSKMRAHLTFLCHPIVLPPCYYLSCPCLRLPPQLEIAVSASLLCLMCFANSCPYVCIF